MVHWEQTWHKVKNMRFNAAIDWKSLLPFCFWSLWLTRNNNVFDKKKNFTRIKQTIARATEYYHVVVHHRSKGESNAIHIEWELGSYKLNTDGAACHKTRVGGAGGVFRNNMGDLVLYIRGLPHTISIEAEFYALWQGLKIAIDHNFTPLQICIDSKQVVRMLNERNLHYNSINFEYRSLIEQLGNPALGHNFRELNQVADLLAKEGAARKLSGRTQVLTVPPIFVNKAMWADILGTVFVRNIMKNTIVMQNNDNATLERSSSQTIV
ncbi:uncharacterized protein [Nicotiana sylvestris]|uniref:uncharacterized protein n=1 Tax=Nicotiana sylvestris TaxID=4096 RepID=UPI00388C8CA6